MSEDKSPVEGAFGNSDLCRLKVERAGKGRSGVGLYCGIGLYCDIATPRWNTMCVWAAWLRTILTLSSFSLTFHHPITILVLPLSPEFLLSPLVTFHVVFSRVRNGMQCFICSSSCFCVYCGIGPGWLVYIVCCYPNIGPSPSGTMSRMRIVARVSD